MPVTPTTSACPSDMAGVQGRRNARSAVFVAHVGDLDELERNAIRVAEVRPAPPRKHALVDRGDVAEELDALGLQLPYLLVDVADAEADVVRAQRVLRHGVVDRRRRRCVLE